VRSEVTWPTIPAMLRDTADRLGTGEAIVDGERRVTYADLRELVTDAARSLIAAGVAPGDRVAIWAPNSIEWIVAALGITTAGAVLVPVNTRFKGSEAAYILARSGARVLFTVRGFLDTDYPALLTQANVELPSLEHTVILSGDPAGAFSWAEWLGRSAEVPATEVDARIAKLTSDDPSDVVYTSGTTGSPKGVVMQHGQTLRAYLDWCDWSGLRAGDRYLIVNPFFHIFGYKAGVLASLMRGATIFPLAVFDTDVVCEIVERERITVFPGAPTLYQSLLDATDARARHDISSLRLAVTGAADIPVALIRRVKEELPFERILTGYGLTEAGTVTGSAEGDDFEHIATTVGVPWPGFEVRTVDENGRDAGVDEPGEVIVRGATVMRAYLDDPDATATAIDGDGWLHTGDLGTFDADGYLRIVGRIKDMFIVGGFNAYPAEIENLLLRHPRIAQVAVIGVADARLGEVAKAFVVLSPGDRVGAGEIIEWSRAEMANYKVPRFVEFLDALPVNATGKVVKDELRAREGST
jgi:acyl-CoA synthetase (AMP-forming)/AMP-acid ligase II